jgi:hyperosmotically inducible protein
MTPRNSQTLVIAVFLSCALSIEFLPGGGSAMMGKTAEENIDDASITASVKSTLGGDTNLVRVDVDTHRGVVSLNGLVEYADQRERAEELARRGDGVKSVINNLAIISRSKASNNCCPPHFS